MNYLSIVKKHMELAEVAYGNISTDGTRLKAQEVIRTGVARMGVPELFVTLPNPVPFGVVQTMTLGGAADGRPEWAVTPAIADVPEALAGANQGGEALPASLKEDAPKGLETGSVDGLSEAFKNDGVIEMVGDLTAAEIDIPAVELIGGWPKEADIEVIGLAPNRRMLRGKLPDGRTISLERTHRAFKVMDKVSGKLIRAGGSPLYRVA